ncbi:hypothetical protein [Cytobacillus sp. FSL R5-0377]|nr:hypothetical protein KIS4809_1379 [Bacillus sp. ZZV12-4809]MCM3092723.1 hypothetical protein [Cytobacillus sp. AMY 15.2]
MKFGVKKYIFGHIHTRDHEQEKGMEIICTPLGYYPHEWDCESAEVKVTFLLNLNAVKYKFTLIVT